MGDNSDIDRPVEERLDDEVELQWAAIERLPTYRRLRTSLFDDGKFLGETSGSSEGRRVIDVTKLGGLERHLFIENLLKKVEEDNLRLLQKLKGRIDRQETDIYTYFTGFANSILRLFLTCMNLIAGDVHHWKDNPLIRFMLVLDF